MRATDIQSCHSNEPISTRDPQLFTTGANAMSGTVWLRTIHGSRPHSARRQRCITSARPMPTTTPTSQPTAAIPSVVSAASAHDRPQRLRRRRARDGLAEPAEHVPHVRHREVGGARQHAGAADHDAVGGPEQLVRLPDQHDREDAGEAPAPAG